MDNYELPRPTFYFDMNNSRLEVKLYAPKSPKFDSYVVNISRDKESGVVTSEKKGERFKNKGSKEQINELKPRRDLVCKEFPVLLYGSAGVIKDGKLVKDSISDLNAVRIPALTSKSSAARKKLCDYKVKQTIETETVNDTEENNENPYLPNERLGKKIEVKFNVKTTKEITGKQKDVIKPSLDWAYDITRDLVQVLPETRSAKERKEVYDKVKDLRDNLIDRIIEKYPRQWPVYKSIYIELRDLLDVEADATPDESNGVDLDKAANGIFDVAFDYTLLLNLGKKINWDRIPEVSNDLAEQVEEEQIASEDQLDQEAVTPEEILAPLAETEISEEVLDETPEDVEEVLYDEDNVPDAQVDEYDQISQISEENLADEINNVWDYNYEYEIPEFDFTMCQRSYDPVSDGTFTDLAYDVNNIESLAAHCLKANEIIGGYADFTFRPEKQVNRAEAAKFLMVSKFFSIDEVFSQFNMVSFVERFPDVPAGQWYTEFVTVANRTGVINGYMDGTYKPANNVSTGEFFKMLLTANPTGLSSSQIDYLKSQEQTIVPTDGSNWGPEFFYVVEKFNLLESRSGSQTSVDFNAPMTRGEVSVAIFKYLRDVTPDSEELMNI